MLIRVLVLVLLFTLTLLPVFFDSKRKEPGNVSEELELVRREYPRNTRRRWKGPKTDERINRMLAESIALLKGLGVPVSESVCPEVTLKGFRSCYGRCCPKGSLKGYTEYDFYIEISGYTLGNTEKSLRNTLIHELIHTVPGGDSHTGEWKKWARFVSEKTGYQIRRYDGDETEQDKANLRCGD